MAIDNLTRGTVDRSEHVHQALSSVLILAQCFGQMPLEGVTSPSSKSLKFTFATFKIVYTSLLIIGATFVIVANLLWSSRNGISFADIGIRNKNFLDHI